MEPAGLSPAPSAPVRGRSQGPSALGTRGQGRTGVQSIGAGGAAPGPWGQLSLWPHPKAGQLSGQGVPEPGAPQTAALSAWAVSFMVPNRGRCPGQGWPLSCETGMTRPGPAPFQLSHLGHVPQCLPGGSGFSWIPAGGNPCLFKFKQQRQQTGPQGQGCAALGRGGGAGEGGRAGEVGVGRARATAAETRRGKQGFVVWVTKAAWRPCRGHPPLLTSWHRTGVSLQAKLALR